MQDVQSEVDQSLEFIESQQVELSSTLDHYEQRIKEVYETQGAGEAMTAVDQERERAYHLAEGLNKQMDDMGAQLKAMIEGINLKRAPVEETAVSVIVKILGQHLSSLQWLDESAREMEASIRVLDEKAGEAMQEVESRGNQRKSGMAGAKGWGMRSMLDSR